MILVGRMIFASLTGAGKNFSKWGAVEGRWNFDRRFPAHCSPLQPTAALGCCICCRSAKTKRGSEILAPLREEDLCFLLGIAPGTETVKFRGPYPLAISGGQGQNLNWELDPSAILQAPDGIAKAHTGQGGRCFVGVCAFTHHLRFCLLDEFRVDGPVLRRWISCSFELVHIPFYLRETLANVAQSYNNSRAGWMTARVYASCMK